CWEESRATSSSADTIFAYNVPNNFGMASLLGELWVGVADDGAGAKFRYQPSVQATVSSSAYLYVTMQVDSYTSGPRYPQILLTTPAITPLPIDKNMAAGSSLLIQSFTPSGTAVWPDRIEVELCAQMAWDVGAQCPGTPDFHAVLDPAS